MSSSFDSFGSEASWRTLETDPPGQFSNLRGTVLRLSYERSWSGTRSGFQSVLGLHLADRELSRETLQRQEQRCGAHRPERCPYSRLP